MGIIYLTYSILLSVLIFIEVKKYKQAIWWSAVVLFFPPATPVVIHKTRKGAGKMWIVIFIVTFLLAVGGEIFLYSSNKNKNSEDVVPPILKKMLALNENIKKSTGEIYNTSGKLLSLSMVQSRIKDLQSTIETIGKLRQLIKDNQEDIDRLLQFTEKHEDFVRRKNLSWVYSIKEFYNDYNVAQHHKSRANYFVAFEAFLNYTQKNFKNIMELKNEHHMKNYEVYYLRYRRAADSHNRFIKKRIAFQSAFVEEHPEIKPFLPGAHQQGNFKFWDKFQF